MKEHDKLKEHVKKRCEMISYYCDGAQMCSDIGKPLYEFATSLQIEINDLIAQVHNFALICDDD